MAINPDMTFDWKAEPDARQSYVLKKRTDGRDNDRHVERVCEDLMIAPAKLSMRK